MLKFCSKAMRLKHTCTTVWHTAQLPHCAGAANAGVPLAMIVQRYGWNAFFVTMVVSCAVVVLLMTPMANLKSYSQREAQGLIKAA